MNNKNKIVIAITLLILGAGGFYLVNSQRRSDSTKPGQIVQSHRSYEIEVTSDTDNIKPQEPVVFTYKIKNDKGEILKDYAIAHEKIMHLILVRKDLQNFQHLHPEFIEARGEFSVSIVFPTNGAYRLFPDFTPGVDNPQKLPITVFSDIKVGDQTKYNVQPVKSDTQTKKTFEDYQVTFTVPAVKAREEFSYSLMIERNGQPVIDLEKYLGALGHSVIIKAEALDFIHTHALETTSAEHGQPAEHDSTRTNTTGPEIRFSTTLPEAGIYKIYTQFQHQGDVKTVDYTIQAF